jgi:hypothetical protein
MRCIVDAFVALLVLLAASAAGAQTPAPDPAASQAYLAARQGAVAELEAMAPGRAKETADGQFLGSLQPVLQEAVGPIPMPAGFDREMMMVPGTLCCGVGLWMLDGFMFFSPSGPGQVLVTTETLFRHWLQIHARNEPTEQALVSGNVLSKAIASDWRVTTFTPVLPIAKPADANLAVAALAFGNQGVVQGPPQQIVVSVIKGGRVYVAFVDRRATDPPITMCGALYEKDRSQTAFDRCWAEHSRGENAFPALTREAQVLADRLAAN